MGDHGLVHGDFLRCFDFGRWEFTRYSLVAFFYPPLHPPPTLSKNQARRGDHYLFSMFSLLFHLPYSNSVSYLCSARRLNDEATGASVALQIASYWSAVLHLILAILGTFILKRFSTAFTVGCFLGVTVVVSQQNLLLFAAFVRYQHGDLVSNVIFAYLALALFLLLSFFSLILGHFRHQIIVRWWW